MRNAPHSPWQGSRNKHVRHLSWVMRPRCILLRAVHPTQPFPHSSYLFGTCSSCASIHLHTFTRPPTAGVVLQDSPPRSPASMATLPANSPEATLAGLPATHAQSVCLSHALLSPADDQYRYLVEALRDLDYAPSRVAALEKQMLITRANIAKEELAVASLSAVTLVQTLPWLMSVKDFSRIGMTAKGTAADVYGQR